MLAFGSLFAGIGGFDLGLERSGMRCAWQVERDPFCQQVLAKHWPNVQRYGDIHDVGKHNLQPVDLLCGGFPCQPFSNAGERRGEADDRNLWPQMLRLVQELQPRWVVGENVTGFIGLYLDRVLADLEVEGYEAWTVVLPAVAFGARHLRARTFVVAHTYSVSGEYRREAGDVAGAPGGGQGEEEERKRDGDAALDSGATVADAYRKRCEERKSATITTEPGQHTGCPAEAGHPWEVEPRVGRVADGIPDRMDRLRALGNAVVPQVVEHIGRAILAVERTAAAD